MKTSGRLGLQAWEPADAVAGTLTEVPQHNVDILDNAAIDLTGTLANRPPANTVKRGTYYFANDTAELARSDGSVWHVISDPAQLGVNTGASVRRGKSIVATSETFTQSSYGYATTPDRVQNIVLPSDGLIFVAYQAIWRESVSGAAQAAIFVGANQLKVQHDESGGSANGDQSALNGSTAGSAQVLATAEGYGLVGSKMGAFNRPANWTTGQVLGLATRIAGGIAYRAGSTDNRAVDGPIGLGGPVAIFAAAGTYDIGVKFKSSSGSISVEDRRLWVWTIGF